MFKPIIVVSLALALLPSLALAQPGGSYQRSCDNIRQRGPFLTADCETVDGDMRRASIDLRFCRGSIANSNGRLTCGRGYGGGERFGGYGGSSSYGGPGYDERDD